VNLIVRRINYKGENLVYFEIIGEIKDIETIAIGGRIRDIMRIQKQFGHGRWRKLKGIGKVRLESGRIMQCRIALVRSPWHWQKENENQEDFGLKIWIEKRKTGYLRFA